MTRKTARSWCRIDTLQRVAACCSVSPERLLVGDVVDEEDAHGIAIMRRRDGLEPLLPRRVQQLPCVCMCVMCERELFCPAMSNNCCVCVCVVWERALLKSAVCCSIPPCSTAAVCVYVCGVREGTSKECSVLQYLAVSNRVCVPVWWVREHLKSALCCRGLQCPTFSNSWREYACVRCERERFKSAVPCSDPCVCVCFCVGVCVWGRERGSSILRFMVCVGGGLVCVHTCLCERVRACDFLVSRANTSSKPPNSRILQCGCGWAYEQYVYMDIHILLGAVIAIWDTNSCCQIQ